MSASLSPEVMRVLVSTLITGTLVVGACGGSSSKPGTSTPADTPAEHAGRIAFESRRDGNQQIYVMNADGSSQTRLAPSGSNDQNPAWSPDCGKIAFHSNRDGNNEIYVMNADGSSPVRLTNNPAKIGRAHV